MPLYSQCDFWPDALKSSQAFSLCLKLREPRPFRFKFIVYMMYSILSSQSYSIFMCWKDLRVGFDRRVKVESKRLLDREYTKFISFEVLSDWLNLVQFVKCLWSTLLRTKCGTIASDRQRRASQAPCPTFNNTR